MYWWNKILSSKQSSSWWIIHFLLVYIALVVVVQIWRLVWISLESSLQYVLYFLIFVRFSQQRSYKHRKVRQIRFLFRKAFGAALYTCTTHNCYSWYWWRLPWHNPQSCPLHGGGVSFYSIEILIVNHSWHRI